MQLSKIANVTRRYPQDVVATREEHSKHLRDVRCGSNWLACPLTVLECDLQDQHIMPHLAGIQLGLISIDDPRFFELRHAAQAGRWRQPTADARSTFGIRALS